LAPKGVDFGQQHVTGEAMYCIVLGLLSRLTPPSVYQRTR